jgi:hypothetical protein
MVYSVKKVSHGRIYIYKIEVISNFIFFGYKKEGKEKAIFTLQVGFIKLI